MTSGLLLVIICLVAFLWPEVSFSLFLCAGAFKADPRLAAMAELFDPTLLLFTATLAGVVIQIIRKQLIVTMPSRQLLVPYYVIVLMMITGLLYTPAPVYGQEKTFRFLVLTSFVLFIPSILFTRQKAISRFLITFVSFALVFSLLSIMSNIGTGSLSYISGLEGANYLALGRIAGIGLLICLYFYVIPSTGLIVATIGFSASILLLVGVLVSGGRGPLISLLMTFFVVFLFMIIFQYNSVNSRQMKQKLLLVNSLMIAGGGVLLYRYGSSFERIFYRLEFLSTASGGDSVSARFAMIHSAIEAIFSFPTILLGLGIGGFSVHYGGLDDIRGIYPHNIILETTVELGLFAMISLIAWLFYSLRAILRIPENHCYKMTFLALLVFAFCNAMVSGDFNDNRFLFFSIGTILSLKRIDMT